METERPHLASLPAEKDFFGDDEGPTDAEKKTDDASNEEDSSQDQPTDDELADKWFKN